MAQNQEVNNFADVLTETNYESLEKEFLKYADCENYEGVYEFTEESGLQMDWGKYDYSAPEEEQEPDMQMLNNAINKFNQEFIGRYVASGDMADKFNSVNILDLQQLNKNECFLDEVKSNTSYKPYKTALDIIEKFSSQSKDQNKQI